MSKLFSSAARGGLVSFAVAVGLAVCGASVAIAQPADPTYQAQQQDYQNKQAEYQAQTQAYEARQENYEAKKEAYQAQRAGYRASQDLYAEQRALYALGRAEYEARFGPGSYDEYTKRTTTTTVISPAGTVESRTKTTVITH